jgi:hypothetical protein
MFMHPYTFKLITSFYTSRKEKDAKTREIQRQQAVEHRSYLKARGGGVVVLTLLNTTQLVLLLLKMA